MLNAFVIGSVVASLLGAPATDVSNDVPPQKMTVQVVTTNGSGCPAGSATVTPAADNTSFTVSYDDYIATAGAGAKPTDFRKNCQLSLKVGIPQGFTYAIAKAEYRGYGHLAKGATAQQNAYYYFMGASPTAETVKSFTGPFDGNWSSTDTEDVATLVYAPCGATVNLNANTDLRVNAGATNAGSYLAMDSARGGLRTVYQLSWKRC